MTRTAQRLFGLLILLVMVTITASVPARGMWWCDERQEMRTVCCCESGVTDTTQIAVQPHCCDLANPPVGLLTTATEGYAKPIAKSATRRLDPVPPINGATSRHPMAHDAVRARHRSRPLYLQYCSLQT